MSTRGQFNSKSPTIRRILREAAELSSTPSPDYTATPLDEDLFEWHFTLRGPPGNSNSPETVEGGPYHEGIYHGRIVLPPTYPLRPPSFRFLTPSGRFETNREICLSISGHHEETWQPAWGLRTALVALRTFMETDAKGQLGGLECTDAMRRRMAKESQNWKCSSCGKSNGQILQESVVAAEAADSKPDDVVPKELKMGWKDEMGKPDQAETDAESTELAEGFVQTAPQDPVTLLAPVTAITPVQTIAPEAPVTDTPYPAAQPALQGVPQPTATIPFPAQPRLAVARQQHSNDGVPAWIDKLIMGLVACLVFMILKVIFV